MIFIIDFYGICDLQPFDLQVYVVLFHQSYWLCISKNQSLLHSVFCE